MPVDMKIRQVELLARRVRYACRAYATVPEEQPTEASKASVSLRRFWDKVQLSTHPDGFRIALDGKPIRTPSNHVLEIPPHKRLLASMVAHEWDTQERFLKTHALPITSIASRALDLRNDSELREGVVDSVLRYFDTDTVCFHADEPPILVSLQNEHWIPLLEWVEATYGVQVDTFNSILVTRQPDTTKEKLRSVVSDLDHWALAALERATLATKSFLVALALVKGRLDSEGAATASHVEVESQIRRWGEVEDSHDVDHQDVRRQLGSAVIVLSGSQVSS